MMISASLPGEALAQLGPLALYPPPTAPPPEFLAPPPRPYARYPPRRRDVLPAPPAYPPGYPFLHHPASYSYLYRRSVAAPPAPPAPTYPLRPRPTSGFVPPAPAPAPRSPPVATPPPAAPPQPAEELRPVANGTPPFCRGALIRLEDGSLRRVEEMRTEDFVMCAELCDSYALTQSTLLRVDERRDTLSLTLAYDNNRTQVELESTLDHPFFVYGRGWASCRPEQTLSRYGLRVQRLQVGDICVSLVPKKYTSTLSAPPQTHPENLSVKEDARKRRWSASDVHEDAPVIKKR